MRVFIFSLMLTPISSLTLAEEGASLETCLDIQSDAARLQCYDSVAGFQTDATDSTPQFAFPKNSLTTDQEADGPDETQGDQWREAQKESALDGRKDVWLSVKSKNSQPNVVGSPERAILWVRCMENTTNIFVTFERYTSENQNVRYRIDQQPVQSKWMQTMRGGEGIGLWSGSSAIAFARELFNHNDFVVSYDTYTGPVEFEFDISGLRDRISSLARSCQWDP